MTVTDQVFALAQAQDGLVTRGQVLALGMSKAAIRHALGRGGGWQRIMRGIYATFNGPLQPRHRVRAALMYAGTGAVVSGTAACRAYGLRYVPESDTPLVLVQNAVQRAAAPIAQMRRVRDMPDRRILGGLPVAPPERAVLDACAGQGSLRVIRALLCEAVQRGLTTPDALRATLGDARWPGSGLVRTALDDLSVGCRSAPECELRDLIGQSSVLKEPMWNVPLPGDAEGSLIPDACWPDARVVVEVDSAEWHRFGDRVEQTERRRARYAAMGWTILPVSPRRLRSEPAAVLAQIEAAVQAGLARRAGNG